jgi:hypothetical protein
MNVFSRVRVILLFQFVIEDNRENHKFLMFLLDSHVRRTKIKIETRIGSWLMLKVWKEETEQLGYQSPEQNLNRGYLNCETVVLVSSRQISVSAFLYTRFRTVPGRLNVGCVHVGRRLQLIWFHYMQISPNLARVSMYGVIPRSSVGCRYIQSPTTSAVATPEVGHDLSVTVFWDGTSYCLVECYQRFGGTCCLHLQGKGVSSIGQRACRHEKISKENEVATGPIGESVNLFSRRRKRLQEIFPKL